MSAILEIKSLAINYDQVIVLENASAKLDTGKLTALIGRNGAGKSSLINAILGNLKPTKGSVVLNDKEINEFSLTEKSKLISMVRTDLPDLGYMTVKEFVALGRYPYTNWSGKLQRSDLTVIDEVLNDMQISSFADRYLFELSDGERQKTIIARSLVQDTALIFMDEPIAFVDPVASLEILSLLKKQCQEKGKTILFSSHDLGSTFSYADNIWLIDRDKTLHSDTAKNILESGKVETAFGKDGFALGKEQVGFKPVD